MTPPVVWSVAGTDSGGGAGLAADQRAADLLGVHLCGVVAAVTAQNSVAVTQVAAMPAALLEAQFAALADDLPPAAIKTGVLGSAENVHCVARWVDRLRTRRPVALVVDPVLRASTGAALAGECVVAAYRDALLPRATMVTPNRREAAALLRIDAPASAAAVPALAAALRALGATAVCITGGDDGDDDRQGGARDGSALVHDWLASEHASGWLTLPRVATVHAHGSGCTHSAALAAALARGLVAADAAVLAKMQVACALRAARAVGRGAGPVRAGAGAATGPGDLPWLSLDQALPSQWCLPSRSAEPGVYAIVDCAARVEAVLAAGAHTVQLRIKRPADADAQWPAWLRGEVARSVAAARRAGVTLYVNDHWQAALELGAAGVHLGQEDLLALDTAERGALAAARRRGLRLGLSSHSPWELCRAAAMQPDYIACGPVWPTDTKRIPWLPQGLDNLAWWAAHAPAPVVAIGGILDPHQLEQAARQGCAGACVLRGLGPTPSITLPRFLAAWQAGRSARADRRDCALPALPHASLG